MSRMLNKFRGTLVGALVGDCLGSKYEGVSCIIPWAEVTDYTLTRIKDNKEAIPYTDDTAMTRAICKSLTEEKKYDNRSMAQEFVQEFFKEPDRGYGAAVGKVFERLRDTNPEDVTLPARSQFDGQGSHGNGAAMRISPVALFSGNSSEVQKVRNPWLLRGWISLLHRGSTEDLSSFAPAVTLQRGFHNERPIEPLRRRERVDNAIHQGAGCSKAG